MGTKAVATKPKTTPQTGSVAAPAATAAPTLYDDNGQPIPTIDVAPVELYDDNGQPIQNAAPQTPPPTADQSTTEWRTSFLPDYPLQLEGGKPKSVGGFVGNIGKSAGTMASGFGQMLAHPLDTLGAIGDVGFGMVEKLSNLVMPGSSLPQVERTGEASDAFVEQMRSRYGGLDEIGNTLYYDPVGSAFDISGLLSGGSSALASRMPATSRYLATAAKWTDPVSATGRLAGATARGAGTLTKSYLGMTTGTGREAIDTVLEGSGRHPRMTEAMRGPTVHEDVLDEVRSATRQLVDRRRDNYRARLAQIDQSIPLDIVPVQTEMQQALGRFNVSVKSGGKELDFSRSALRHSPQEMAKVQAAFDDVMSWGTKPGDLTPSGFDILKQGLDELTSTSPGRGDAIVRSVHDRTRALLDQQVPGYAEMTADYATASRFLNDLNAELSVGPNARAGTGIRKLTTALNQRNDYRRLLVEQLDTEFGTDIRGMLAGLETREVMPHGLAGRMAVGTGGAGVFHKVFGSFISDPTELMLALAGAATFSPRLVGETLMAIAKARDARLAQAAGRAARFVGPVVFNPATYRFASESNEAKDKSKSKSDEMREKLLGIDGGAVAADAAESGAEPTLPPKPKTLWDTGMEPDVRPQATTPVPEHLKRENWQWARTAHLEEVIPAHLKNARSITAGTDLDRPFQDIDKIMARDLTTHEPYTEVEATYGEPFDMDTLAGQHRRLVEDPGRENVFENVIRTNSRGSDNPYTIYHEIGHAAYEKDLPAKARSRWEALFNRHAPKIDQEDWESDTGAGAEFRKLMDRADELKSQAEDALVAGDRTKQQKLLAEAAKLEGKTVELWREFAERGTGKGDLTEGVLYKDSPPEQFAQSFMEYIVYPKQLNSRLPEVYEFMKREVFKGREYMNAAERKPTKPKPKPTNPVSPILPLPPKPGLWDIDMEP